MNQPVLKEMLRNECRINDAYGKGHRCALTMVLIYIALRFSDPIISPMLSGMPLEVEFNLIFGLLVSLAIGWVAMLGSVKLAGILCLFTTVGNIAIMITSAGNYSGGWAEMMRRPTAWYVLITSILCGVVGIPLLTGRNVTVFGKRRKEIQKEYALALKAWGNAAKQNAHDIASDKPQPKTADLHQDHHIVDLQEILQNAPVQEDLGDSPRTPQDSPEPLAEEAPCEMASEETTEQVQEQIQQQAIAERLAEFKGENSTLRAFSIPSAAAKVSKQRFFDLYREMVCKKFECCAEKVDSATYILTFQGNQVALMKWLMDEKKLYLESDTAQYDTQFHTLMLDVISYLSKSMGAKFDVIDEDCR